MNKQQFIEQIASYVQKYAPQFNIMVCSPIIAQAIIESKWGTSNKVINNGKYMHNYFGLKWRENRCPISTGWFTESGAEQESNGQYINSEMKWHKFNSMEDCILGYFQWTNIPNYANLKGVTDPRTYVENLKADKYATSLTYVSTIMNAIEKYGLTKYDTVKVEYTMNNRVCIDAGHYGKYNKCPNNANYYESEVMWKLHLLQKKYLEQLGIEVVTTRQDASKDLALQTRGEVAKGCSLFISNHTNAVGNSMNEGIDYVAVYHLTSDNSVQCDDVSMEIAKKIAPVIAKVMNVQQGHRILSRLSSQDRNGDGVMNDNYYGILHGARSVNVAGLILEHSFHTNSNAVKWLLDDTNLDNLARAEAECIASYLLGRTVTLVNKAPSTQSTPSKVRYVVQAGAYVSKTKAEEKVKTLKAKGFDAFIVQSNGMYKIQAGAYSERVNAEAKVGALRDAGISSFITTRL